MDERRKCYRPRDISGEGRPPPGLSPERRPCADQVVGPAKPALVRYHLSVTMRPININDVLDGHVVLEVHCADRLLAERVRPQVASGGQVVTFLTEHLGFPGAFARSAAKRSATAFAER